MKSTEILGGLEVGQVGDVNLRDKILQRLLRVAEAQGVILHSFIHLFVIY